MNVGLSADRHAGNWTDSFKARSYHFWLIGDVNNPLKTMSQQEISLTHLSLLSHFPSLHATNASMLPCHAHILSLVFLSSLSLLRN